MVDKFEIEDFWKLQEKRARNFTLYSLIKSKHYEPNVEQLKVSCEKLITMFTQTSAGQRRGNETDGSVNWEELERVKTEIITEALCMYLAGRL